MRTIVRHSPQVMTQKEMRQRLREKKERTPRSEAEKAQDLIAEYRARYKADPEGPEAPALLNAMGNLYAQKLLNFEEAAWCYQQIIQHHPDWPGTPAVYPELATCFEHAGDHGNTIRIYMEMMHIFPDETPEHQFAKEKLGMVEPAVSLHGLPAAPSPDALPETEETAPLDGE